MMRRLSTLVLAGVTAWGFTAGACTQVPGDPEAVVAIAFDSLPYPAVVRGDTLRDEAGVATPLRASPLNPDGDLVATAPVRYLALDTGVTVSEDGYVAAGASNIASVRLVAQTGALQSRTLTLAVAARPDSVSVGAAVDTIFYVVPDASQNVSKAVAVRVVALTGSTPANVPGWIVRYRVSHGGTELATTDATLAWFVDEQGRRSAEDTTATDGRTNRRLRVVSTALGSAENDSLIVTATASRFGAPLAGSPLRIVIHLRPRQ